MQSISAGEEEEKLYGHPPLPGGRQQYLERLGDARQINYFVLFSFSSVDEEFSAVLEKRSPQRRTRREIRICVYKNMDFPDVPTVSDFLIVLL